MNHLSQMPDVNIFEFDDLGEFLVAYVAAKKRGNHRFSLGVFAKRLGLRDTSSITKIISGKRKPGKKVSQNLLRYFEFFDGEQLEYFDLLVALSKEEKNSRDFLAKKRLLNRHKPSKAYRNLDDLEAKVVANWLCIVIRELAVSHPYFKLDAKWIQHRLLTKVSLAKIAEAIRQLQASKLLGSAGDDHLRINISRPKQALSMRTIRSFRELDISFLKSASLALANVSPDKLYVCGSTIAISASKVAAARKLAEKFQDELRALIAEPQGELIYQLNLQLFPLTQEPTPQ